MTGSSSSRPGSRLDLPHHDGSPLYVSTDRPTLGQTIEVRLRVPHGYRAKQVVLRAVRDGEPHLTPARVAHQNDHETWWHADLLVHNPVTRYRFFLDGDTGSRVTYGWLTGTGLHTRDVTDAHDFVAVAHDGPPGWVSDAVVYQVFPDRFARSSTAPPVDEGSAPGWAVPTDWDDPVIPRGEGVETQWYGGDLDGVIEHLDHMEALGVTTIYLTPVFEGRSNHRYDAVSFERVDPALGGDEALQRLTAAAHGRGMRVVGDLTTNHTGVGHEWFVGASADDLSPSASYYRFGDHPHGYVSWLDVPSLPKLDHSAPALRDALYRGKDSVVGRWLHDPVALDGWRIDVANMTGRHADTDDAHQVARDLRATMAEAEAATGRHSWLLAEHGHDASRDLDGDGWHGTMNYTGFTRPVWTWLRPDAPSALPPEDTITFLGLPVEVPRLPGRAIADTIDDFGTAMSWRARAASSTQLDSHDTARFRTVVGGDRDLHLVGLALLATLPGVPTIFAGDEIGLEGVNGEHSRTPFPWHRPEMWDEQTLDAYRRWFGLRTEHVALRRGGLRWAHIQDDSLTFVREHPSGSVLVHVARAEHPAVHIPLEALRPPGAQGPMHVRALYGSDDVGQDVNTVSLSTSGPAAHAYQLGVI